MKILLKTVFVIAFAMLVNNTFAQQKFAHINRNELIQSMPEVKEAQDKLEAYYKELQSDLEALQVEYNKKLQEYTQNSETWTEERKEVKLQELQRMDRNSREQQQVSEERLSKRQEELFTPILKKATDAIAKIAKEGGYIYVFESTAVHYFDETQSTNILPLVKKELGIN